MATKAKHSKADVPVNITGHYLKERKTVVSIEALSWAAERAGLSYGRYMVSLSSEQQQRIQKEYEAWKKACPEARRKTKRHYRMNVAQTTHSDL